MQGPREGHVAVPIGEGVVIAGGAGDVVLSTAERWDPKTNTTTVLPSMFAVHDGAKAVAIDRSVLVTGGRFRPDFGESSAAELWDGARWTQSRMSVPHVSHTATVLGSLRAVLVVGGSTTSDWTDVCEVFRDGVWKTADRIPGGPVAFHTATYVPKLDAVLVTGGTRLGDGSNDAYLYRAATGWTKLPGMLVARTAHAAALLTDGRVLVVGGSAKSKVLTDAELFDPATSTFTAAAPMNNPRAVFDVIALPDGRAVAIGGYSTAGYGGILSTAELYDAATDRWLRAGTLSVGRAGHASVPLTDGRVVVMGGFTPAKTPTSSIEVFERRKPGETCADDGECVDLLCDSGRCLAPPADAGPSDGGVAAIDDTTVRACTCNLTPPSRSAGDWYAFAILALFARRMRGRSFLIVLAAGCARASEPERTPTPAPSAPAVVSTPNVSASVSAPPPPPPPPSASPPPAVDVRDIGMHIGGGPNDDANKAPLLASIAPHHEALGRCWESLPNKPKLELGVDADVPAKGGRAKISHPRSTVKDAAFLACAVKVFEQIEWLPPKSKLDTTVSASVRLIPRH